MSSSKQFLINLEIYDIRVQVFTAWEELYLLLKKDFSYFLINESTGPLQFSLEIKRSAPSFDEFNTVRRVKRWKNSRYIDLNGQRFVNYKDNLKSSVNFKSNSICLESESLSLAHEKAYLAILSRVGKLLDEKGIHRLHGMAFSHKKTNFIMMGKSGVGKSTLLSQMLKAKEVQLISDDTPLIDQDALLHTFGLRMGFEKEIDLPFKEGAGFYNLLRDEYGLKFLASLEDLEVEIDANSKKNKQLIVINLSRSLSERTSFIEVPALWIFIKMIYHGVIGFGLPIIFEYFVENSVKDCVNNFKIAMSRGFAFFKLALKAKSYEVRIGKLDDSSIKKILSLGSN